MSITKPEIMDAVENIVENFHNYGNLRFEHLLHRVIKTIDGIDITQPVPNNNFVCTNIKNKLSEFTKVNKVAAKRWTHIHAIGTTLQTQLINIGGDLNIMNSENDAKFMALELKFRLAANLSDTLAIHIGNYTINGIKFPESLVRRIQENADNPERPAAYMVFMDSDLVY